jgi:multiple antibiotic resistance protein
METAKQFVTFFGLAFSALLPLINPLGDALVFMGLVGVAPAGVYRALSKRIAVNTTLFMIVIQLVGTTIFRFFGISLPVIQVSGGLVIAAMGWNLLNQSDPPPRPGTMAADGPDIPLLERQVFYPFTFPITAGPGCVVVMVTLSAHASAAAIAPVGVLSALAAHAGIVAAVMLLSVAVYICYSHAPAITARVRPDTTHGILRVIAFVLFCIGVQITWNGVSALLKAASLGRG